MQNAGIHMVRIGEFAGAAWSLARATSIWAGLSAVALAARHGIVTVLGTPAAAPPAWLTQKYPDTLKTLANGRLATHG